MKYLIVRIPSGSPAEDRMSFVKAILNSLKYQRDRDLPLDMQEHNYWLAELANHLLPDNEEMRQIVRCLEEQSD